jgi:tetratricopeptide (TPR) repeat protein
MRGDLDWITLKAMDAVPAHRYGSASELAEDIRRYLNHEPVSAVRPSRLYRTRKFVRRNRMLVMASACVALSMCAGIILTTWQMVRARRAEQTAIRNQQRERAINTFLNDLLETSNPRVIGGRPSMSVEDLLREALAKLDRSYDQDPAVEVPLRMTIGGAFRGLGFFDLAERQFRKAYEMGRRSLGETSYETLRAGDSLVAVLSDMNRPGDAAPIAQHLMDVLKSANRSTDRRAIVAAHRYAETQVRLGKLEDGIAMLRQSLRDHERYLGADDSQTLDVVSGLGRALRQHGELDEAESMLRRAIDGYTRTVGPEHPVTLARMHFLGRVLEDRGDIQGAERIYRQSIAGFDRVAPSVAQSQRVRERLAILLFNRGDYAEAERLFRKCHEAWKHLYGPDEPEETLRSGVQLVETLRALGNEAEAGELGRDLMFRYQRVRPGDPMRALLQRWEAMPATRLATSPTTTTPTPMPIPASADER